MRAPDTCRPPSGPAGPFEALLSIPTLCTLPTYQLSNKKDFVDKYEHRPRVVPPLNSNSDSDSDSDPDADKDEDEEESRSETVYLAPNHSAAAVWRKNTYIDTRNPASLPHAEAER